MVTLDAPAPAPAAADFAEFVARIDAALPQTQCTRCGYPDCRGYATAIAAGTAEIDRCPPGGAEGVRRLAALTGRAWRPLDPACGVEAPRQLAVIDEDACIGCTLCLDACPVDALLGGPKSMHVVVEAPCTGCALCLPVCPVDCIALQPASGALTGWDAWSPAQAETARARYGWHRARAERTAHEREARLRALSAAAIANASVPVPAGGDASPTAPR